MRHYEIFENEELLRNRIHDLRNDGYVNDEFTVYSAETYDENSDYYYDGRIDDHEDDSILDRIKAFFTGEKSEEDIFDNYDWDDETKERARRVMDRGGYVLVVDRDDYYTNDAIFAYRNDPLYMDYDREFGYYNIDADPYVNKD